MTDDHPITAEPTVDLGIAGLTDAIEVGHGGFAVVYRAYQRAFGRFVAVKVFGDISLDDTTAALFERECRAIGRISGRANILTVHGAGTNAAGRPYLVMPYMEQGSLDDRLRISGRISWSEAVDIGIRLAKALQVAHEAGVLHRDVKPDNVLISDDGQPLLADFGIARLTDVTRATRSQLAFTPAHVAPEVLSGNPPTAAMDVYSLASTIFMLIVGRPPFVEGPGESVFVIMRRISEDSVPDLMRPLHVPEAVCLVIEASMAKDPADRPPTAGAFAAALETAVLPGIDELSAPGDGHPQALTDRPDRPPPESSEPESDLPLSAGQAVGPSSRTLGAPIERPPGKMSRRRGLRTVIGVTSVFLVLGIVAGLVATRFRGLPGVKGEPALEANLMSPNGVAVAGDGSVYIAESGNARVRLMSRSGLITTVVGNGVRGFGGDHGRATAAELNGPHGLAVASDGTLYIADFDNNRVRKVTPTGVITTAAGNGQAGFGGDGGPVAQSVLNHPSGVAVAADGSLYIADFGNNRVRRVAPTGVITTVAGSGLAGFSGDDGPSTQATLSNATAVSVAPDGNLYIADYGNHRIRRVSPGGVITTVAGNGQAGFSGDNGPATAAELNSPNGVTIAGDGSLYIADYGNARVRRVSSEGTISTFAGNPQRGFSGDNGPATAAELSRPTSLAVTADGTLFVADTGNNRIRRVTSAGVITTAAGKGEATFSGDHGPAIAAELSRPSSVVSAQDGTFYFADTGNNRIRRVTSAGVITTVAGDGKRSFGGDYGLATSAELSGPTGIALAGDGSVYIADTGNDRVRRVGPDGVITTIAGNGQENFSGDNGPAINAELNSPNGVAVADDGTLYVADYGNNRVRRVSPTGVITSAAGNGQNGYRGDGALATAAELSSPTDVALGGGSLYIVDFGNGRIRRVNPAGVVSTVAGNGERTFSGDDGVATAAALSRPNGVTVARDGSFYIADSGNNRIRRVSPTGLITTVAGNGQDGFSGDHGRATSAALSGPAAAAIAGDGSLYIADAGNNRIRHVSASGVITTVAGITTTS